MIERFIAVGIDRAGLGEITQPAVQQRRAAMRSAS
jgi:hypothetical protein